MTSNNKNNSDEQRLHIKFTTNSNNSNNIVGRESNDNNHCRRDTHTYTAGGGYEPASSKADQIGSNLLLTDQIGSMYLVELRLLQLPGR